MDETLIFLHIPKTAGTTFAAILRRNFPRSRVARVYPEIGLSEREFKALPEARRAGLACVMGHFDFGLHRSVPGRSVYATFLRDPVRQTISRYRHIRASRWHPLHYMIRDGASIEDFARRTQGNYQTRALCGVEIEAGRPHPVLGEEDLARAKQNLRERFAVVGITERFDESVLLAGRSCGLRDVRYVRRNVRARSGGPELSTGALHAIEEQTGLDRALYAWAQGELDARIAQGGEEFLRELDRFRQANARYARLAGRVDLLAAGTVHVARLAGALVRRRLSGRS